MKKIPLRKCLATNEQLPKKELIRVVRNKEGQVFVDPTGETLIKSISANKVELVLIANDASDNTKKKITDKCQFYHVDYFIVDDIETISKAIGKHNRVAVGITNQGFAKKIKEMIGG